MKKKNILGSILVSAIVLSGAGVVQAANYPSAEEANSNAEIEFIEQSPEIVDPGNPEQPVDPVDPTDPEKETPTNPNGGDLVLQYVPDLDFGIHKKTTQGMTAQAKLVNVKDINDGQISSDKREVIPFVSTWDSRHDRSGWTLTVSRDDFKAVKNHDNKLTGADVTFSQMNYANEDTSIVPSVSNSVTVGTEPEILAQSKGKVQGMGTFSLSLGDTKQKQKDDTENKTEYNVTNGVTFKLAERAAVSAQRYQSTFTWNLQPDLDK